MRYGRVIRIGGRTVPAVDAVAEIAHELRYGTTPLDKADRYFVASCLDVLVSLVHARGYYGAAHGDRFRRAILAQMMEES